MNHLLCNNYAKHVWIIVHGIKFTSCRDLHTTISFGFLSAIQWFTAHDRGPGARQCCLIVSSNVIWRSTAAGLPLDAVYFVLRIMGNSTVIRAVIRNLALTTLTHLSNVYRHPTVEAQSRSRSIFLQFVVELLEAVTRIASMEETNSITRTNRVIL